LIFILTHASKGDDYMASVEVNKQAPDFQIEDFKGEKFQLSDFKEKKNVLIVLNRGFS
jgi:peroxiredoxin